MMSSLGQLKMHEKKYDEAEALLRKLEDGADADDASTCVRLFDEAWAAAAALDLFPAGCTGDDVATADLRYALIPDLRARARSRDETKVRAFRNSAGRRANGSPTRSRSPRTRSRPACFGPRSALIIGNGRNSCARLKSSLSAVRGTRVVRQRAASATRSIASSMPSPCSARSSSMKLCAPVAAGSAALVFGPHIGVALAGVWTQRLV